MWQRSQISISSEIQRSVLYMSTKCPEYYMFCQFLFTQRHTTQQGHIFLGRSCELAGSWWMYPPLSQTYMCLMVWDTIRRVYDYSCKSCSEDQHFSLVICHLKVDNAVMVPILGWHLSGVVELFVMLRQPAVLRVSGG